MENNQFSVIIRTRNEERWVGHTIQSVLDNLFRPEIIIIDNNSSDNTLEIVRRFQSNPNLSEATSPNYTNITIHKIDEYTPGKSLNMGIELSNNDNLMIISSHCVIAEFDEAKVLHNLKKFAAIFGKQIPVMDGKKITPRYVWSHFGSEEKTNMYSQMEDRYFFHNAFSFFHKKIVSRLKFDEYLSGKEDRYWAADAIKENLEYLYDPSLKVFHHYTPNGNTWKGNG